MRPRLELEWRKVYASLSFGGRLRLLLGVFLLFAPYALLHDLAFHVRTPWYQVAVWSVSAGLISVAAAELIGRSQKLVLLVVILCVLPPALFWWSFWLWRPATLRVYVDYFLCVYMVFAGYTLLIRFIRNEGITNLRHRAEIALARDVHAGLVPPISLETDRADVFGSSEPATEVGGDLLDFVHTNGRMGIYVADVTGHGVPAGVTMSMLKSAIRMRLRGAPPLGDLVRDLNEVLIEVGKPGVFATLAAIHVDAAGRAECSLAGHPPILHYRAATRGIDRIEPSGPPLGVLPAFDFATVTVTPEPRDLLVVLTDGLIEVFDERGSEFGLDRFAEAVRSRADRPLAQLHSELLESVRRFGRQTDDQTLILLRWRRGRALAGGPGDGAGAGERARLGS